MILRGLNFLPTGTRKGLLQIAERVRGGGASDTAVTGRRHEATEDARSGKRFPMKETRRQSR